MYHGSGADRRTELEYGLPCHFFSADWPDGTSVRKSAALEKKGCRGGVGSGTGERDEEYRCGRQWCKNGSAADDSRDSLPAESGRPLSLRDIVRIPGAKEMMVSFFCYSMVEQTTSLWAGSYLVLHKGMSAESAAGFAGLFFIGITVGRFFSGFLTMKFSDSQMIRLGQAIILLGVVALLLPVGNLAALSGLLLLGLGCAPIYPSIIHSTPENFGRNNSQAVMGVQMAFAYVGTCLMPPVFGLIANGVSVSLFPLYPSAGPCGHGTDARENASQKKRRPCREKSGIQLINVPYPPALP